MKKILCALLCIALLSACAGALAQSAGNLNNGAFIDQFEGDLLIALEDGIWRIDKNGGNAAKIADGRASMLQVYEGRLYYLAEVYGEDEYGDIQLLEQTPMSCLPDGSDAKALGEAKTVGIVSQYPENEGDPLKIDAYVGYRGFTVSDGAIYYLSNSGEGGRYTCTGTWYDENDKADVVTVDGVYESGIALYKMDLNGENTVALTGVIGNSVAQMAVANGKIYLAGGYTDTVYAYNYVNYSILDGNGAVVTEFHNPSPDRENLFSEAGEFYHIPEAVLPDGENLLVSLSDSEGDFVASQLHRLSPDGALALLVIEQNYVASIIEGNDLYYVGSESTTNFYDDSADYANSLGIYRKDLAENGIGIKLAALPFTDFMTGFSMCVVGDSVYYMGNTRLCYRVSTEGGELSILSDTGFKNAVVEPGSAE